MISKQTLVFLKGLKKHNNKEWFDSNRSVYEQCRAEYQLFVGEILSGLKKIDPTLAELEAKKCMFRINRDIRFSKNKDPYKTNFGSYFSKGGKNIQCSGYYFHLEPGASFIAGGYWMPPSPDLKKIRSEIDYCFDEFKMLMKAKSFRSSFDDLDREAVLSRPPQGYDIDNPALEYLKLKSFTVTAPVGDEELLHKDLVTKVVRHFEAMKPMIYFLNRSLD